MTNIILELEERFSKRNKKGFKLNVSTESVSNFSLPEFLENFLHEFNYNSNTLFIRSNRIQTYMGRRRSLRDIYKICKYYYPNCLLQDVVSFLYGNDGKIGSWYCSDVRKRVWWGVENNLFYSPSSPDEYGYLKEDYLEALEELNI